MESRPDDIAIDMSQLNQQQQSQQLVEQVGVTLYVQLMAIMISLQDHYIQDRAETMENIESTIVELGVIFKQLAEMVKDQEEQVERYKKHHNSLQNYLITYRIDANVAEVDLNVQAAHTELLKYFQSVTSNRWLMVKIFLVLIVFFIIFVVFLT